MAADMKTANFVRKVVAFMLWGLNIAGLAPVVEDHHHQRRLRNSRGAGRSLRNRRPIRYPCVDFTALDACIPIFSYGQGASWGSLQEVRRPPQDL